MPYRGFQFQVKSINQSLGQFSGVAAAFGNTDKVNDIIERGAFRKTLQDAYATKARNNARLLWPICWMHDANAPVGVVTAARETTRGLEIDGRLDLDTESGRRAFSGMQMGYASALSIGYDTVKAWRDRAGVRHLLEIKLWEVSLVTSGFAANDRASVDVASVKTADRIAFDRAVRQLVDDMRNWRNQRPLLGGNPKPAVHRDPGPPQPDRNDYVTDRLWQEALDDWAAKLRGAEALRDARQQDQRRFDDAVRQDRDQRVRSGTATVAEQRQFCREYRRTPDGQPLSDQSEQFGRAMRDLEERRTAYHNEHGYNPDDDR